MPTPSEAKELSEAAHLVAEIAVCYVHKLENDVPPGPWERRLVEAVRDYKRAVARVRT